MTTEPEHGPCAVCGDPFGAAIHDPNDERGYGDSAHDYVTRTYRTPYLNEVVRMPTEPAPVPQEASR